ncbi:hypothetical protein ABZ721_31875 [Streptomyces sp. NPDC006733]|uniref:hypothetical protein n=1 Tax=Streptomyces sp. NPDC006733 TaxID=3155460 RepID=UPI0033E9E6E4
MTTDIHHCHSLTCDGDGISDVEVDLFLSELPLPLMRSSSARWSAAETSTRNWWHAPVTARRAYLALWTARSEVISRCR